MIMSVGYAVPGFSVSRVHLQKEAPLAHFEDLVHGRTGKIACSGHPSWPASPAPRIQPGHVQQSTLVDLVVPKIHHNLNCIGENSASILASLGLGWPFAAAAERLTSPIR